MEIIISFLIGICILYIGVSFVIYMSVDEIKYVPKPLRPGAYVGMVAVVIIIGALFSVLAYAIGNGIYQNLIK